MDTNAFQPFDYGQAVSAGTQNAYNTLALQAAQQQMQDTQAARQKNAYAQQLAGQAAGGDQSAMQQLLAISPDTATKIQQFKATETKDALAAKAAKATEIGRLAQAADTPDKWNQIMGGSNIPDAQKLAGHFEKRGAILSLAGLVPKALLEPFTLGAGQQRFGPDGKLIAAVAPKPDINNPANLQAPGNPNLQGQAYLDSLPPTGTISKASVQAVIDGRQPPPSSFVMKTPYGQQFMAAVAKADPSFDLVNFNARYQTRKAFTSGQPATQINAMNTVIGHLKSLSDAASALNNSSTPMLNRAANWLSTQTGDPRVKQFDTTKKAVVDELTRVWRGSGGSEQDIKTWSDQIDAANSPNQLHGVIAQIGDLLESKLNAMAQQYQQGMGSAESPIQLVTPKSRTVLTTLEQRAVASPTAASSTPAVPASSGWRLIQ